MSSDLADLIFNIEPDETPYAVLIAGSTDEEVAARLAELLRAWGEVDE